MISSPITFPQRQTFNIPACVDISPEAQFKYSINYFSFPSQWHASYVFGSVASQLGLLPTPSTVSPVRPKTYIFPSLPMVKSEKVNASLCIYHHHQTPAPPQRTPKKGIRFPCTPK